MAKSEKKFPFVAQYRHFPRLTLHTGTENEKGGTFWVLTGLSSLQSVTIANTAMGICITPERQWNSRVVGTMKWLMAFRHLPRSRLLSWHATADVRRVSQNTWRKLCSSCCNHFYPNHGSFFRRNTIIYGQVWALLCLHTGTVEGLTFVGEES